MSLLMDALKKAEQEKKEAAKRLKEAQGLSGEEPLDDRTLTQELSTEDEAAARRAEIRTDEENQDKLDDTAEIEGLSISPIEDKRLVLEEIEEDDSFKEGPSISEVSEPVVPDTSLATDDDDKLSRTDNIDLEISEITDSETGQKLDHTFALADYEPEEEPVELAGDTVQAEQVYDAEKIADAGDEYEYFSATVSAAQLAKDIGGDSPTPVAAQTVFAASASQPGSQVIQWGVFAVLCLVIAVSLSFFVFNYTIPVERSIKSPLVARGVETSPEPVPTIEIPEQIVSGTVTDRNLFDGEITEVIEKENETVIEEAPAGSETKSVAESAPESVSESGHDKALAVEAIEDKPELEQEKIWYPAEDESTKVAIAEPAPTLPEKITLEPRLIKISRNKSIDDRSVMINKAFQEYLAGDYMAAEASYNSVLKELPENRDALLGLAAIAIRKGHLDQAYKNYLEILKLYPGDSIAEAALINFQNSRDYTRNESLLKSFIQKEPDNSFLYFSLGRLYAAQTRWPEAQQSFFDAYRIETSNPEYAFNLAVSLDHIGQQKSAIDYYNAALDLANQTTVGFDRAVVISRISALSNPANLQ